jgi:hypothetical protein
VTFEHPGSLQEAVWRLLWLSFVSDRAAPPCLGSRVPVIKTIKTLTQTLGTGYNPTGSSDVVPPTQTPSNPVDGFRPLITLGDTLDCHVGEYPGVGLSAVGSQVPGVHTRSCEEDGVEWSLGAGCCLNWGPCIVTDH